MNLILDAGNSYVKIAVFHLDDLVFKCSESYEDFYNSFLKIIQNYSKIEFGILSSVGAFSKMDIDKIKLNVNLIELTNCIKLPYSNLYKTPKTLGKDRLALISASMINYSNKNVLVIDAGTCITFDFKNNENQYLGGAISPGLNLRYKALNNYTNGLPLLEKSTEPINFVGNTTNTCMHSGVINGVVQEIDGVIAQYNTENEDLTVILTGGDAKFLSLKLKSSIFANSNFLLEGLNYLLNYNRKE